MEDNNNQSGKRADKVKVQILNGDKVVQEIEVSANWLEGSNQKHFLSMKMVRNQVHCQRSGCERILQQLLRTKMVSTQLPMNTHQKNFYQRS